MTVYVDVPDKLVESPVTLIVSTVPAATGLDEPEAVQVAGVLAVAAVFIMQLVMALPVVDQSLGLDVVVVDTA
jgi:hypothetical protein